MIRFSSTTTNTTLLSSSFKDDELSLSSYAMNILKRFFIIFGSICFLWLIMGLIFASIQTFRHFKKRSNQKCSRLNRSLPALIEQVIKSNPMSDQEEEEGDDEDDDDRTSIFTSISFLSEKSKTTLEHTPCERIAEDGLELTTPSATNDPSLYHPGCRNFAYSQSTLTSAADFNPPKSRPVNLKRQASQSSTHTTFSQITNATYLSSLSHRTSSIKPLPLPTVMITDCDRLQTDIIELEHFEPEKDWRRIQPELRLLLNERMPQTVR